MTDRARRSCHLAKQAARRAGAEFTEADHLLLGLLTEGGANVPAVLQELGINPDVVREQFGRFETGAHSSGRGLPPWGPDAKTAIDYALGEAEHLGHKYLGTEHLLLGLLRLNKGIVADILRAPDASLDQARTIVRWQSGVTPLSSYGKLPEIRLPE
ncbi:MAG: Clp protease N-terminal domain-containing protein [Planctomycetaceae bacterium]